MNDQHRLDGVTGSVIGADGQAIGTIVSYYLDDRTGEPNWVRVGSRGPADGILPAHDAEGRGQDLHVPYTRAQVADAPGVGDVEGHLEPEQERELYRHYGLDFDQVRGGGAAGAAASLGTDERVPHAAAVDDRDRTQGADISDVGSGHNPLRTDRGSHNEGELRPDQDDRGDGDAVLTTRGH